MILAYRLCRVAADGSTRPATLKEAFALSRMLSPEILEQMPLKGCDVCSSVTSSMWRTGPVCAPHLCNAIGIVRTARRAGCGTGTCGRINGIRRTDDGVEYASRAAGVCGDRSIRERYGEGEGPGDCRGCGTLAIEIFMRISESHTAAVTQSV